MKKTITELRDELTVWTGEKLNQGEDLESLVAALEMVKLRLAGYMYDKVTQYRFGLKPKKEGEQN